MIDPIHIPTTPSKVADIISATAGVFDVPVSEILARRRTAHLATARIVAMALTREKTWYSLQDIGAIFSGRDHGTIIHAVKRLPEIESHPRFASLVRAVRMKLAVQIKISKTSVHSVDFSSEFLNSEPTTFSGYLQPTPLNIRANSV